MRLWGEQIGNVKTEVPGAQSRELSTRLLKVESPSGSTLITEGSSIFWERAAGANVEDADGNVYVDLTAAFCVSVAGHANPRVVDAIAKQAARLMHHPGVINPNGLRVELCERLSEWAPGELSVSHLASTGAEANEIALKAARLFTGQPTIVSFHGGFHGKTTGALAASTHKNYRQGYQAFLPGVVHAPYPNEYRSPFGDRTEDLAAACADYLTYLLDTPDSGVSDVAGVILEPIQGQGGWVVPPPAFLQRVREITRERGIVMIVDEIITGFGRTGARFCIEHAGVTPDIIVTAKGMASGFPISAVTMRPEIAAAFRPVQHTSTFMGNPMGCAAALACIDEIESRRLIARSTELGAIFTERLEEMKSNQALIGDVRGMGSMMAIELVSDRDTKEPAATQAKRLVAEALARGVIINNLGGPYKNVIKMSPPLVITDEQMEFSLDVINDCLTHIAAGPGEAHAKAGAV